MTIITGGSYSAMALLFAYGLKALISLAVHPLKPIRERRRNTWLSAKPHTIDAVVKTVSLIAGMWLVVAFVELFAYALYAWNFGFASERMVLSSSVFRG